MNKLLISSSIVAATLLSAPVMAQGLFGSNIELSAGVPTYSDLIYDSAGTAALNAEIFINETTYILLSTSSAVIQQSVSGTDYSITSTMIGAGIGVEIPIGEGSAESETILFADGLYGSSDTVAEISDGVSTVSSEPLEASAFSVNIGVRSLKGNILSQVYLNRTGYMPKDPAAENDYPISLGSKINFILGKSFYMGIQGGFELNFDTSMIGGQAGFKF
jgi:hypothetical protein